MSHRLSEIANSIYGLDISQYDDSFLLQSAQKRFACTGTTTISEYVQFVAENPDEAVKLFRSLNITHTEFFRDPLSFAHLEKWILPSLLAGKPDTSELRIWSAGCSSGQEAYSLAMVLENIHMKRPNKLRYRIIATDISESALLLANKGEYSETDIQRIRVQDLREFFCKTGETYTVCDRIKANVSFATYDLLDSRTSFPTESVFGNFDLVICSNILFYYKEDHQHRIVEKLIRSMDEHGYLLTGETEIPAFEKFGNLYQVVPPSPIFRVRKCMK